MSKTASNSVKPFYRPPSNFLPGPAPTNRLGPAVKQFVPGSFSEHTSETSSSAENKVSAGFVSAVERVKSTNERVSETTGSLNAKKLQDRITSCLALQASSPSAWAISMHLRPDLAPQSRFRLACNGDGNIDLTFHSKLLSIVESIRLEIPSMVQALAPWSTGTPVIQAELCTSVDAVVT